MAIPLLDYSPSSQNQRVAGYEVAGEEKPRIYSTDTLPTSGEMDELIWAAYYQVFHEQQMLASNRQPFLESQLNSGQITVKEFIQGLVTSDSFRRLNYESNNNYRFVEICIQRLLGRNIYDEREKLAWSIVIATKGLQGFVNDLLNSQEYIDNFGENTVPYQRRRVLPQRMVGELPFARMSRYGEDYRNSLPKPTLIKIKQNEPFNWDSFLKSSNGQLVSWILLCSLALLLFFYASVNSDIFPVLNGY